MKSKRLSVVAVLASFILGFLCGIFVDFGARHGTRPAGGVKKHLGNPFEEYEKILREGRLENHIRSIEGKDASQWGTDVANPLCMVTEAGVQMFSERGVDIEEMAGYRTVLITGSYCGANTIQLINKDPEVLLVIGEGFTTHGNIYSLGPILATADSHFMGKIISTSLVWCIDESCPRGLTIGFPLVFSDTASISQSKTITEEVWHGDYGLSLEVSEKEMETVPVAPVDYGVTNSAAEKGKR